MKLSDMTFCGDCGEKFLEGTAVHHCKKRGQLAYASKESQEKNISGTILMRYWKVHESCETGERGLKRFIIMTKPEKNIVLIIASRKLAGYLTRLHNNDLNCQHNSKWRI